MKTLELVKQSAKLAIQPLGFTMANGGFDIEKTGDNQRNNELEIDFV